MNAAPHISFAVPAHDEEHYLPAALDAIHASARPLGVPYEIVVADDASTDRTAEVAREHGAKVVRVDRRQIAAARNAAARASSGAIFIFVDADTLLNPDALQASLKVLESGAIGGGCLCRFDGKIPLYARCMINLIVPLFRLANLCGGSMLFCTRSAYEASGGWDEAFFASEEIHFARTLKRLGRFSVARPLVTTSGRKFRTHSGFEILGSLLRLAFAGPGGLRNRQRLAIWYGPRRADPHHAPADTPAR